MPAHRTSMRKLKEVLRLKWACGLSHRQIGRAVGISVGAISEYAALATAAGLDWPSIEPLSDDEIEECLLPKASTGEPATGSKRIPPDFTLIHRELRRKGVTLQLLWEEYVEAHAAARTYRYTQFCQLYKDWALTLRRSMRQQHRAGERLFADFAGHTVPIVAADGDIAFQAHVFVAVLGASSYTFACATRSEGTVDWIGSIIDSMEFFGGVPELLVPDNPRALIAQPDRYEPVLGATTQDFVNHYSTAMLPARPRKPQDKAYASYCTLCGWWNSDKRRLCRTVATALSFDQDDVADGLVQAAMQVTVAMLTQQPALAPQMNASRAHSELCGEFVGCQHAAFAQAFKPALESIGGADDIDLLGRERFTFPVCVTERIKLFGDLPIRAGFEEFVDLRNDFWQRLANQCNGLGLIDLQRSRSPAAKAYMDRDAFGLDQGYVFNEQGDHALALDRHDSLVIPNAREVLGERPNLGPRVAA